MAAPRVTAKAGVKAPASLESIRAVETAGGTTRVDVDTASGPVAVLTTADNMRRLRRALLPLIIKAPIAPIAPAATATDQDGTISVTSDGTTMRVRTWRGELKEIWVGDSHAALTPARELGAPLRHIEDGRWVCHLGGWEEPDTAGRFSDRASWW